MKIEVTLRDALIAVVSLFIGFACGLAAMENDIQTKAIEMGNGRYERTKFGAIKFVWIDRRQDRPETKAEEDKP